MRAGLQQNLEFAVLTRSTTDPRPFEGLAIDRINGDLDDCDALDRAIAGCDVVIHSAAHIHLGWQNLEAAMRVNRDGTRNIVNAAVKHRKPMVYVSTVNTLAIGQRDKPSNEMTPGDGQIPSTYVLSKRAAEDVVRSAMDQDAEHKLNATIVYPGFMLGPYDWKPSSGRMIVELSRGCPPMSPAGGCSVCDVRDVAAAIINIVQRRLFGERIILAGHNMSYFDLWTNIAKRFQKRGPFTILRRPGQFVVGTFSDRFLCKPGKEVDTNSAAVKMGSQFHYYDSSFAKAKLDYQSRDVDQTLDETIEWLGDMNLVPR